MTRRPVIALLLTGLLVSVSGQERATFRSGAVVVTVNVSVHAGNNPVRGLGPGDFDLTDNGVPQRVVEVGQEDVPVDVTLVIDTSGSMSTRFAREKSDARRVAALLSPSDRYQLVTIGTYAREAVPWQAAGAIPSLDPLPVGGVTASNDALLVALMSRTQPGRRHLVVAMTDGRDNISSVDAPTLLEVARRSDAVLHVVLPRSGWFSPRESDTSRYFERWMPYRRPDVGLLEQAARVTGGEWHGSGSGTVEAFRRVYTEFRRGYVLRFVPSGVSAPGWHDLRVSVPRCPTCSVAARKGYDGGPEGSSHARQE